MVIRQKEDATPIGAAFVDAFRRLPIDEPCWVDGAWAESTIRAAVGRNQFLVVLKPELFEQGAETDSHIIRVFERLQEHGVGVVRAALANGRWSALRGWSQRLYPRLWLVARYGTRWLGPPSVLALAQLVVQEGASTNTVLSAAEFLRRSGWSAEQLRSAGDNAGCLKLGAGAYVARLVDSRGPCYVLNPFALDQLERFRRRGALIGLIHCVTDRSWRSIRQDIIGSIEPSLASVGSIRRDLATIQKPDGSMAFSIAFNGIHVSPGPIEAAAQIRLSFGDTVTNPACLHGRNPGFRLQHLIDAFEATEDVDGDALPYAWSKTDPVVSA